jgi:hypothetical protein
MESIEKTVFPSYRRTDFSWAQAVGGKRVTGTTHYIDKEECPNNFVE